MARKITFAASTSNKVVINDESITDLGTVLDYMLSQGFISQAQRDGAAPYENARQATSSDLITLTAASVIGTLVGGDPTKVNGVSVPLADQYVLIPSEITEIQDRTADFNDVIAGVVAGSGGRLALADVHQKFSDVFNKVTTSVDGIPVNATFAPPTGLFSEDGVHPNNRGSAYIAKIFIEAINATFGATVPLPSIARDFSTHLPVNGM
jgi:hypothetical protein